MNGYYYLMTSLPTLSYKEGGKVPFTKETFIKRIDGFVPKKDKKSIEDLLNGKSINAPFMKQYNEMCSSIQRAVLHYRALRLGKNDSKYILKTPESSDVMKLARSAVEAENPYESELKIFELYWKALDKLSAFHFADFLSLSVYALKLRLLFRKTSFDKQKGRQEATRLFASYSVLEDIIK